MSFCRPVGSTARWMALVVGLGLVVGTFASAQFPPPGGPPQLRGPNNGAGGMGAPQPILLPKPSFGLLNNGSLLTQQNKNANLPNQAKFIYIATMPLGDRFGFNGFAYDDELIPNIGLYPPPGSGGMGGGGGLPGGGGGGIPPGGFPPGGFPPGGNPIQGANFARRLQQQRMMMAYQQAYMQQMMMAYYMQAASMQSMQGYGAGNSNPNTTYGNTSYGGYGSYGGFGGIRGNGATMNNMNNFGAGFGGGF
ncbi:MAG: hypothetical protein K2R98_22985 [Gemmataceae bacterium]|nr:hypothetical protein [Gemmataceae bacterium]